MAKILIADDSLMMRKVARMSLEKGGHTVIEAEDGAQAVTLAKAEMPQLILLDAEMPELDGFEASKAIKADPATSQIPVLICTGHDLSEEQETLKNVGAAGSISKPYNPAQLLEKVSEVLKNG